MTMVRVDEATWLKAQLQLVALYCDVSESDDIRIDAGKLFSTGIKIAVLNGLFPDTILRANLTVTVYGKVKHLIGDAP